MNQHYFDDGTGRNCMDKIRSFFQKNKSMMGTLLFAAFVLIQFSTMRLANQAGRGYLATEQQEFVYLFLQIIVIAGIMLHMLFYRLIRSRRVYDCFVTVVLCIVAFGEVTMLFAEESSLFYLVITGLTVLCLGFTIGAVYLKLSAAILEGAKAGACVGIGYAAATALQYVFQLQWTVKPVLLILLIASFTALAIIFQSKSADREDGAERDNKSLPPTKLIISAVITLSMLLFISYYNSYIHHLQIASGYNDYNVYSWPRLLMIPAILMFCLIGDIRDGRFLPISALCVVVIALLNTALLGRETYLLNMCLYYISLTAVVAYYHLTFLRMASRTRHPEIWAPMGRLLDSLIVIISFVFRFSELSMSAVLAIDIAALASILVLMAVNGDFNFNAPPEPIKIIETVSVPVPVPAPVADPFPAIEEEYGISPSEMKVLRELVMTSDKQEMIAERLNISISTLKHHISSIYKKTNVKSRAALCQLAESKRRS